MKKVYRFSMGLLFVLFFAGSLQAQSVPDPVRAGFSPGRLQRIDTVMKTYIQKGWINGAVAIVYRNGIPAYFKAFGYNDLDSRQPLKTNQIFRLASMSKAISSVAVMMLYEEGRFLLDDPIGKYIPEFANQQVIDQFNTKDSTYTTKAAKRQVTIRDLLTHTAGIGYPQIGDPVCNALYAKATLHMGFNTRDPASLGEKMKILGSLPLLNQPGEKWSYGLNTDLLGYLVEVISGQSFAAFLQQRIFAPLGMKDTYFYLPAAKHSRLATQFTEGADGKLKPVKEYVELNGKFYVDFPLATSTYYSGGGGLCSTAEDYAVFLQMLVNGGVYQKKRLLSPATIRLMTMNQTGNIALGKNRFGLGFEIVTESGAAKGPLSEGSYSWAGAFNTSFWVDPREKLTAELFLQILPTTHGDIHDKFKVLVYQAIEK